MAEKKSSKKGSVRWLKKPKADSYPAAEAFLSLMFDPKEVKKLIQQLRDADDTSFLAKDILRATRPSLVGTMDATVKDKLKEMAEGEELSPILLVRDPRSSSVIV